MTKSDLILKITEKNKFLLQKDVQKVIDTFFGRISDSLENGNRIELRGFGAFGVKNRSARIARNPRTGEAVQVDEKFIPRFKTGKELRLKLNSKNNTSVSEEEGD